jgi:hypothetical protein
VGQAFEQPTPLLLTDAVSTDDGRRATGGAEHGEDDVDAALDVVDRTSRSSRW